MTILSGHLCTIYINSRDVKRTHKRYSNKPYYLHMLTMLKYEHDFALHITDFVTSYLSIILLYHYSKPLQLYTTARLWWKVHNLLHRKMNRNLQISSSNLMTEQRFPRKKDTISLK